MPFSSPTNPKGIHGLPSELLLEIIEHAVTRASFLPISLVCKRWSSIVQPLLWKIVEVNSKTSNPWELIEYRPPLWTCIRVLLWDTKSMDQSVVQNVVDATAPFLLELRLTTSFQWINRLAQKRDESPQEPTIHLSGFQRLKDLHLSQTIYTEAPSLSTIFPDLPYTATLRTLSLTNFDLGYRPKNDVNKVEGEQKEEIEEKEASSARSQSRKPTLSPDAVSFVYCSDANPKEGLEGLFSPSLSRLKIVGLWGMGLYLDLKYSLLNYLVQSVAPLEVLDTGFSHLDLDPQRNLPGILTSIGPSFHRLELYKERDQRACRIPASFLFSLPPTLSDLSIFAIPLDSTDDPPPISRKGLFPGLQRLRLCSTEIVGGWKQGWTDLFVSPAFVGIQIMDEAVGSPQFWRDSPCFCEYYKNFGCQIPLVDDSLSSDVLSCQFCTGLL